MPLQCTSDYVYNVKFLKKFGWEKISTDEFEIESHKVAIGGGTFPMFIKLPYYQAIQSTINRLRLNIKDERVMELFMEGKIGEQP